MKLLLPTLLSLMVLSGCSEGNEASCDSQVAANLMADNVKAGAKQTLIELGSPAIGGPRFDEKEIDDILRGFEPSLTSVRSTKSNSDSNKKFCSGSLTFKFPDNYKASADKGANENNILLMGMLSSGTKDFGVYATQHRMTYSNGHIGDAIEYSVQPSDDGKQLFVEFSKVDQLTGWISQFSSAVLMGQKAAVSSAFANPAPPQTPDTDSCVDAKGKKYHAQYGEDALVTSDAIDEWTNQCKAGS